MSAALHQELKRIGHTLLRRRALLQGMRLGAVVLACVWIFSLLDFFLQNSRPGRVGLWMILAALVGLALRLVIRILRRPITPQGVAASIERAFPELDNHLINYLQFAEATGDNPFRQAYLKGGPPAWTLLDFRQMSDRKAQQRSGAALAGILLLMLLPSLFFGRSWGLAIWRTVNPFTQAERVTLTRILEVNPGDTAIEQGTAADLSCLVQGRVGHEVWLDVDPGDAEKRVYGLGRISGTDTQTFKHRLPKVATGMRYRFRAGDAARPTWYQVEVRPPPAFTSVRIAAVPPAYTGRAPARWDAPGDNLRFPRGSSVTVDVEGNTPLHAVTLKTQDEQTTPMTQAPDGKGWTGTVTMSGGATLLLTAEDDFGSTIEEELFFTLEPDQPPVIEIVSPQGRTVLPPGGQPRLEFQVVDDYGLAEVTVERIEEDAEGSLKITPAATWTPASKAPFQMIWKSGLNTERKQALAYRVTARDISPFADNTAHSPTLVFVSQSHAEAADQRNRLEKEAFATLSQVVEKQRINLARTEELGRQPDTSQAGDWAATTEEQRGIRTLTRELLTHPLKPLGRLTDSVNRLYMEDMAEVITTLEGVPGMADNARAPRISQAIELERGILRQLDRAVSSAAKAAVERRMSGISAMLTAIVRGQDSTLKQTREHADNQAPVGDPLIEAQDRLAEELTDFMHACEREAGEVRAGDDALSAVLLELARQCEDQAVRNDMVMAAEQLDNDQPGEAIPLETAALDKLKALQDLLEGVRLLEQEDERQDMLAAVQQAKEKLERIKELHERMLASMEQIRDMEDFSEEQVDMFEEEYEELFTNTREAVLDIPTDQHVFMDLNVANELVEDIFSVFQEIEQVEGSEAATPEDVIERAFAKEEVLLEGMEEALERIDDVETWLGDEPDTNKVTTESFDQEEMPEAGMALGALATEVEDLISDLLEEDEETAAAADDGAVNHGVPDMETGWKVEEGNIATFSAKGKSGNTRPDHKEQDGRSNVGRQGMSSGETAAGSGTISEGDEQIDERRTQDPTQSGQVDLDGEADTNATGGGKLATGKADSQGMNGGIKRMDSNEAGSWEGMAALMAQQADAMYAKASLQNIRVDALKEAAHHLRQSGDAIAQGNIGQVKELKRLAVTSLQQAGAELSAGPSGGFEVEGTSELSGQFVEGGPDVAPPKYRDLVAEYYKALNNAL